MSSNINNVKIQYPSITILLTALLCVLKVTGTLSISWWWCFCLIWLPFALLFALIGLIFVIAVIVMLCALVVELVNIYKK